VEVPEHPEGFAGLFLGQLKSILIQALLFLPSHLFFMLLLFSSLTSKQLGWYVNFSGWL
jgi:hypothetical protein